MGEEAELIEAWARKWEVAYRDDANRWSHISVGLGVLTAGAGAIAGASGLADKIGAFTVSLVALAAALLNVIGSSSRPAAKSSVSSTSAIANTVLADRARLFRLTRVGFDPMDTVLDEFTELCELRETTVKAAPMRRAPGR